MSFNDFAVSNQAEFVSYQQEQLQLAEIELQALKAQIDNSNGTSDRVSELEKQVEEYELKLKQGGKPYRSVY